MSCIQKGPRDFLNSAVSHPFRSDVLIVASVLFRLVFCSRRGNRCGAARENAFLKVQYLLDTKYVKHGAGRDRGQADKPRPLFSPDGKMVLFHSDCDGQSQIFMATGYEFPQFAQDR